jgi:DNA helicase-2/ATP-dependent DNA helicase PcrA
VKHLLESLNDAQKHAVQETEGPGIVLAGPGSGKTRVLTHRLAWLIANGVDPFRILSLTFTNKASNEMKERVVNLIGEQEGRNVWMGTFHSVFARILRYEAHAIGYNSNFTIYDTDDSKSVIRQILKEQRIDDKIYTPSSVLHRISSAKMSLMDPTEYNANPDIQIYDHKAQRPLLGHIYSLYWNRCRRSNAMDFDDILYNMNVLLRDFPEIKDKYQRRFHYVLVDEYQDTCFSQYNIIKKLTQQHRNICVVGDDAQGIYAFRGARIENILNFSKDYPDCKVFKLEQNYRSTKNIVQAANSVIRNNEAQLEKTIWTDNSDGDKIKLINSYSETDEAVQVAQNVFQTKMNFQCENSDFAILYRTNAQSRALEEAFRKFNIPYKIYGGLSFYKRKEIKDLMAYFRITVNQNDEEAILRIINIPVRGIGKTTIDRLIVYAHQNELSLWELITEIKRYQKHIDLNNGITEKIDAFATMISRFRAQHDTINAYDLANSILYDTGYFTMLKTSTEPEAAIRLENIEELINGIQNFTKTVLQNNNETEIPTLSDFLLEVSLLTDIDEDDEDETNRVAMMTVHASKGLEFPYVYITGLEENLFPSSMSIGTREEVEEERRLFYVAITRAMKRITLSYAESRLKWGKRDLSIPSRFIDEIDERIIETPRKKESLPWTGSSSPNIESVAPSQLRYISKNNTSTQPPAGYKKLKKTVDFSDTPLVELSIDEIIPGVDVRHESFGKGKVLQVDGNGTNKKAVVFFPGAGKKNLLLKFAKLTIIE